MNLWEFQISYTPLTMAGSPSPFESVKRDTTAVWVGVFVSFGHVDTINVTKLFGEGRPRALLVQIERPPCEIQCPVDLRRKQFRCPPWTTMNL